MKVVIFKSYQKKETVAYNYGDDVEDVWHNFNIVEETREMTQQEFEILQRAISHFNLNKKSFYTLNAVVVLDDDEFDSLISDYKAYEAKESARRLQQEIALSEKLKADKDKREATKVLRTVKKLAKELSISEDEVRVMLASKK